MRLRTERLIVEPVEAEVDTPGLLEVLNSNPDFVEASTQRAGVRQYSPEEVTTYCLQKSTRENGHCLTIRLRSGPMVVGIIALLRPNPVDGVPWVGLLATPGSGDVSGGSMVLSKWLGQDPGGVVEPASWCRDPRGELPAEAGSLPSPTAEG